MNQRASKLKINKWKKTNKQITNTKLCKKNKNAKIVTKTKNKKHTETLTNEQENNK